MALPIFILLLPLCTAKITFLSIEVHPSEIVITCTNTTKEHNAQEPFSSDTSYLTAIDDTSRISLADMARKCFKTKVLQIKFSINLDKLKWIWFSKSILEPNNQIDELVLVNHVDTNKTTLMTSYLENACHLEKLVVRRHHVPVLQHEFDHLCAIKDIDLSWNSIGHIQDGVFGNLSKLERLALPHNAIATIHEKSFEGLDNLKHLDLSYNRIKTIDRGLDHLIQLERLDLSLNLLQEVSVRMMHKLKHLDLSYNHLDVKAEMLYNLSSLKTINLSHCGLKHLSRNFMMHSQKLHTVNLSRNSISNLESDTFQHLSSLSLLDLSNNILTNLPHQLFNGAKSLEQVKLNGNAIDVFDSKVFSSLSRLKVLDMSNNRIETLDTSTKIQLDYLYLTNNSLTQMDIEWRNMDGLDRLDISNNSITSLTIIKDDLDGFQDLEIYLCHNQISEVHVTTKNQSWNNWNVFLDLTGNLLKCNCLHYVLEGTAPSSQTAVLQLNSTQKICYEKMPEISCPLIQVYNCPPRCRCYYTRTDDAINVDCTFKNLTIYPKIANLDTDMYNPKEVHVNLSHNLLTVLGQEVLETYENVTELDLSNNLIQELKYMPLEVEVEYLDNNKLTLLPDKMIDLLKNSSMKLISLKDNPWSCSCEALNFKKFLTMDNNNITKKEDIKCHGTNNKLIYSDVCKKENILNVALPVGLSIFFAIVITLCVLYFKFNSSIKVYLYSKNMCLWFVAEEEIDKDKTYDVFISYSHKDEDFVVKHILPELEGGEDPFQVCIHFRNWLPGEFISSSIINSVLDSRRTLVILSNSFMESVWGKMEFKTAYTQAISEGMARVVVVIYGELDEDGLDEEMKMYLKTNTYVKWGDPWFWNKLRYALPHRKMRKDPITSESRETFHLR